jgi:methylase of polypeptide subunit release factors
MQLNQQVQDRFVMQPSVLTTFLLEHLAVAPSAVAVDLGCGGGALAIETVKRGAARCWAIDLNSDAVFATHVAARAQFVSQRIIPMVASIEDVSELIPDAIDLVVSNPPQLPELGVGTSRSKRDMAYDGGADGRLLLDLVIANSAALLKRSPRESGELFLVTTSVVGIAKTMLSLAGAGFVTDVVAQRDEPFRPVYHERLPAMRAEHYSVRDGIYFETLYILRSRLPGRSVLPNR